MLYLEKMKMHTITSGNYVTSVHGMVHPNRIIGEHDFYISWTVPGKSGRMILPTLCKVTIF